MMKRFLPFLLLSLSLVTMAQERLVGGDISLLPSYEQYNTPYYTSTGKKIPDLITYVKDSCGWNACRVRLFVNPVIINPHDNNHQGEVQSLAYIVPLCRRIKAAGMRLLLDFHYSDTWADPTYQIIPEGWQSLTTEEQLADTLYHYTYHCLDSLVSCGIRPDYIQLGNEISYGMLKRNTNDGVIPGKTYAQDSLGWKRLGGYLKAGAKAVREVVPEAKIIIHTERVAKSSECTNYYRVLSQMGVDYDIIGLSYYPFWHGYLDNQLSATLTSLTNALPSKPIQIVEAAYYNNYWPVDENEKSTTTYDTRSLWPASAAGQDAFLQDLIAALKTYPNVNGLYYWFPEENGCGGASWSSSTIVIDNWINRGLFNPNNHKEYAGLRRLGTYIESAPTGLTETSARKDGVYYSVSGQAVGRDGDTLPAGMYIHNGQMILNQK